MINRFRREVYQSLEQRGDAGMDVIDGLSSAEQVKSPVQVSESALFRGGFSRVYDFLQHGIVNESRLRRVLYQEQPEEAERIAGYEVYGLDCSDEDHAAAETLADRSQSRKGRDAPKVVGHRYSWLVRLVKQGSSWCMVQDIERVSSDNSDSAVGAEQVKRLDQQSRQPKVVVADSLYGNVIFLCAFLVVSTVYALVRLRRNLVLYEEPAPRQPKQRGRTARHGRKFKLAAPSRSPDRCETVTLLKQSVRLQAWHHLHFRELPALVGLVLSVEFLKADGSPRFKRPLLLFWTGPLTVPLVELARMYLWRFAIEHMFRFLKQQMGLCSSRSPDLAQHKRWLWSCALAYAQLLLIRHAVADHRPAWQPIRRTGHVVPLTPRQVQRAALPFLHSLGSPVQPLHRAGKGRGRPHGFKLTPRPRHPVVKKAKPAKKSARSR
jgi:hypothetical protein